MDSAAQHMTCVLQVDTQSPGWHKTMTKVLQRISGVSYTIDAERGFAHVSGKVDPDKLLSALHKAGKHADLLWVRHGNGSSIGDNQNNFHNTNPTTQMGYYDNTNVGSYGYYNYHPYMDDPRSGYSSYYPYHQDYHLQYHPYMDDPRSGYSSYYPYHQDNHLQYHPHRPYHQPQAAYFPQPPQAIPNPRLASFCNMM